MEWSIAITLFFTFFACFGFSVLLASLHLEEAWLGLIAPDSSGCFPCFILIFLDLEAVFTQILVNKQRLVIEIFVALFDEFKFLGQLVLLLVEELTLALKLLLLLVGFVNLFLTPLLLFDMVFSLFFELGRDQFNCLEVRFINFLDAVSLKASALHFHLGFFNLLRLTLGTGEFLVHIHDLSMLLLHKFADEEFTIANFANVAALEVLIIISFIFNIADQLWERSLLGSAGLAIRLGAELTVNSNKSQINSQFIENYLPIFDVLVILVGHEAAIAVLILYICSVLLIK